MAQPKRKTSPGMGAVRPSPSELATRPTELQLPAVSDAKTTGARRRVTRDIASSFAPVEPGSGLTTNTAPPVSGERTKAAPRESMRVDVPFTSKRITQRGPVLSTPRVVNAARISKAPLDSREAFVLQQIDGTLPMTDLADATGIAEEEIERIVARLIRLGIVAM